MNSAGNFKRSIGVRNRVGIGLSYQPMSKTKGQTFRYHFGNETKTFWYHSHISLSENIKIRQIRERTQSIFCFISIRYWNVCETLVERLWNVCSFTVLTWATQAGEIISLESIPGLLKSLKSGLRVFFHTTLSPPQSR